MTASSSPATPTPTSTASVATCWRWSRSWPPPSCAIRAAISSPATTGRTAWGRSSSGRGGPRAREAHGLASLSEREREIAALVGDGLTNREIGARLFLSEKTIETHLTRVFQKLGVRSRAQVAAEVARAC
jgi:DNA-binding CsgD family transcriptional regulator